VLHGINQSLSKLKPTISITLKQVVYKTLRSFATNTWQGAKSFI
jgi:hypothetical protein